MSLDTKGLADHMRRFIEALEQDDDTGASQAYSEIVKPVITGMEERANTLPDSVVAPIALASPMDVIGCMLASRFLMAQLSIDGALQDHGGEGNQPMDDDVRDQMRHAVSILNTVTHLYMETNGALPDVAVMTAVPKPKGVFNA